MAAARRLGLATVVALLVGLGLTVVATPASAATGDIGYVDQSFSGVTNPPTADKPQSKLWWNDGRWWADMFDTVSKTWHIFGLDRSTNKWVDTGVRIDDRASTSADALWDGSKLYVATHVVRAASAASSTTSPARMYRYSYSGGKYTLDTGFPTTISNVSSESLTIDKDSGGTIWATWTQVTGTGTSATNAVYLNSATNSGSSWGTPFVMPASNTNPRPAADDISAVVAYQNKVGVLWSNQLDGTVYWAVHAAGAPTGTWTGGVAVRGNKMADDHLNLKSIQSDSAGRVFAVVKTSLDHLSGAPSSSPQINVLVFKPGTGSWSTTTFGTIKDCHTRPQLLLDETNQRVYVFATGLTASGTCTYTGAGTIYMKSAPMDNPVFPTGSGTPFIRDAASDALNNVTTTKQGVTSASGIVVLASNSTTSRYWHNYLSLGGQPAAPTASFTATPTSGAAPLAVAFTDTSTGSPTSRAWNFGDGSTATTQNPSHTYTAAGTYQVTLTVTNAAGSSTSPAQAITVTAVPAPSGGHAVTAGASTMATGATAGTTVTLTKPAGVTNGDVLIAQITADLNPTIRTAPAGWSPVVGAVSASSRARVFPYYHVVTNAGSEPASYNWTLSKAVKWNAGITDFHGVNTTTPFDTAATTKVDTTGTATTLTVPGVTTATAGALVVGGVGLNSSSATVQPPSGWTEAMEATSAQVSETAYQARPTPGATGTGSWKFSTGTASAGWMRALRPAS